MRVGGAQKQETNDMAKIVRFHELGGPEVLKNRRCALEAALKRRGRSERACRWVKSCGIHAHAWVLLGMPAIPCDVGIRSFRDRYSRRSEGRAQLAERECIDATGVLDESVWSARQ